MAVGKILIAVDQSSHSLHAAQKGLELASQTKAQIALVFVIDPARAIENVDAGIFHEDAMNTLKRDAEDRLDLIAKMYNGNQLVKFMPIGHVEKEIIKIAETWGADIVVMGTHGHGDLVHLLMGSVTEYVLRHAGVPVLVVPKKKKTGA